jgi:monoamine oxidase
MLGRRDPTASNEFDLVIIGAGAAGIAAAHAAHDAGLNTIVLEAQDRVGGRAFTDFETFRHPFDHGCQWLHSADVNPLTPLADRLGFRYHRAPIAHRIHDGHWWLSESAAADYEDMVSATYQRMELAGNDGKDVAAATCIDAGNRWARIFRQGFAPYISADPENASVYNLSRYADSGENWPIEGGFGSLIATLAQDLRRAVEVRLSCPVKSVDWGDRAVMVGTLDGMLFARAVVITVSTTVLASERLKFFPLLPDWKLEAIAKTQLGFAEKVAFEFAVDPFLGLQTHFAMMDWPGAPVGTFHIRPFDRAMATLYLGGEETRALALEGEEAMLAHGRNALARLFGADILKDIGRAKATRWTVNPYIGGAYSVLAPGGGEARMALAQPLEDRLFFAGEATSPDAFQTAHGAWLSGQAAVRQVLASPQFAG